MTPQLAVVGALALDEIETPQGSDGDLLGGSCAYAAVAASLLAQVEVISIVGDDLPATALEPLRERGVGLASVRREAGPTFRWGCRYHEDWDTRDTLYTSAGVFAQYPIDAQGAAREATHLMLTAGQPDQNRRALDIFRKRTMTMLDSIEREVRNERKTLLGMLPKVDILALNAYETRILCGKPSASEADQYRALAAHGASVLLCKQGGAGVGIHGRDVSEHVIAVPHIDIVDPTGAGDSFGGATLSALSRGATLSDAARWGCAVASFTIQDFGLRGLLQASLERVQARATQIGLRNTAWLEPATQNRAVV